MKRNSHKQNLSLNLKQNRNQTQTMKCRLNALCKFVSKAVSILMIILFVTVIASSNVYAGKTVTGDNSLPEKSVDGKGFGNFRVYLQGENVNNKDITGEATIYAEQLQDNRKLMRYTYKIDNKKAKDVTVNAGEYAQGTRTKLKKISDMQGVKKIKVTALYEDPNIHGTQSVEAILDLTSIDSASGSGEISIAFEKKTVDFSVYGTESNRANADSSDRVMVTYSRDASVNESEYTSGYLVVERSIDGKTDISEHSINTIIKSKISSIEGDNDHFVMPIQIYDAWCSEQGQKVNFTFKVTDSQKKTVFAEKKIYLRCYKDASNLDEGFSTTDYGNPDSLATLLDVNSEAGMGSLIYKYAKVIGIILIFVSVIFLGVNIIYNRSKAEERTNSMMGFMYIAIGALLIGAALEIAALFSQPIKDADFDVVDDGIDFVNQ